MLLNRTYSDKPNSKNEIFYFVLLKSIVICWLNVYNLFYFVNRDLETIRTYILLVCWSWKMWVDYKPMQSLWLTLYFVRNFGLRKKLSHELHFPESILKILVVKNYSWYLLLTNSSYVHPTYVHTILKKDINTPIYIGCFIKL